MFIQCEEGSTEWVDLVHFVLVWLVGSRPVPSRSLLIPPIACCLPDCRHQGGYI